MLRWLVTAKRGSRQRPASRRAYDLETGTHFRRLRCEALEDRRMLSVLSAILPEHLPTATLAQPHPKSELIVNGGFETGNFAGWTVNSSGFASFPWTASRSGEGGHPSPRHRLRRASSTPGAHLMAGVCQPHRSHWHRGQSATASTYPTPNTSPSHASAS